MSIEKSVCPTCPLNLNMNEPAEHDPLIADHLVAGQSLLAKDAEVSCLRFRKDALALSLQDLLSREIFIRVSIADTKTVKMFVILDIIDSLDGVGRGDSIPCQPHGDYQPLHYKREFITITVH